MQIVICTAYSDHSWEDMLSRLRHSHQWLILKKPFDNIEVLQLASALTEKWRVAEVRPAPRAGSGNAGRAEYRRSATQQCPASRRQ